MKEDFFLLPNDIKTLDGNIFPGKSAFVAGGQYARAFASM